MRLSALVLSLAFAGSATAEAPQVVADIPPTHGIVAAVMEGVATPHLLLPPGASPHGYALRPSDAAALERADLVFWVGHELTPWLERPLQALGQSAQTTALLDQGRTTRHQFRDLDDHDDDHGDEENEEHGHDDHGEEEHEEHGHEGHDHDHEGTDPHAWLDPANAVTWAGEIARQLAEADPANAATYAANADAFRATVEGIDAEIAGLLKPHAGKGYLLHHDAYQYFERRYGLAPLATISESDAAAPGPRRIAHLRALIAEGGAACIFTEPQFPPRIARTVAEGTQVGIATLDPLGADIPPGPGQYPALLRHVAGAFESCFAPA